MARVNMGMCVLCASLSVIIAIPLSPYDTTKHLTDSNKRFQLPAKFQTLRNTNSLKKDSKSNSRSSLREGRLPVMKLKDTTDSSEDGSDGSGGSDHLASITDRVLQTMDVNDTYDYYDGMALPEPERLVPDPPERPTALFSELGFQEMHERAKFLRKSEVKESILSKLRLLAPPNVTALKLNNRLKKYPEHIVPKLNRQPSDYQSDDSRSHVDEFHAKISTVIQFASDFPISKHPQMYPTDSIAYFSLPLTVSERNVEKAMLMIYIATPYGKEGSDIQLCISETLYKHKPFVNRTVTLSPRGHWEHIDIRKIVSHWAADDNQNFGLVVSALLDGKNIAYLNDDPLEIAKEKITLNGDITTQPHRTPLVKITLNEEQGRYRRSFDDAPLACNIKDRDNRCCRYNFVINFQELGKDFDFIIEPRRYLANYCAGSCPSYYLPKDAHSKLVMAFSKPKVQRCCTPMVKRPLNLLYYNENGGIMLGEIPDMSIEKCSCS